uniref:Endonuclease/exonuclease/phosphatase domain-containing protein n=1 Tax=Trichogramma kaykai TaxID=54128 RepID=A0ABD2WHP0_9HYME
MNRRKSKSDKVTYANVTKYQKGNNSTESTSSSNLPSQQQQRSGPSQGQLDSHEREATESTLNNNGKADQLLTHAMTTNSELRRNNLGVFIDKHKPDILAICETKLSKKHKLSINNYTVFRNDRNNQGGGSAILVNNRINCLNVSLVCKLDILEYTVIKVNLINNNNLTVIGAYASPTRNSSLSADLDKLFEELRLENASNDYILIGDLNAKHYNWNNPIASNNSRGRQLNQWLDNSDMLYNTKLLFLQIPSLYKTNSFIDIA